MVSIQIDDKVLLERFDTISKGIRIFCGKGHVPGPYLENPLKNILDISEVTGLKHAIKQALKKSRNGKGVGLLAFQQISTFLCISERVLMHGYGDPNEESMTELDFLLHPDNRKIFSSSEEVAVLAQSLWRRGIAVRVHTLLGHNFRDAELRVFTDIDGRHVPKTSENGIGLWSNSRSRKDSLRLEVSDYHGGNWFDNPACELPRHGNYTLYTCGVDGCLFVVDKGV